MNPLRIVQSFYKVFKVVAMIALVCCIIASVAVLFSGIVLCSVDTTDPEMMEILESTMDMVSEMAISFNSLGISMIALSLMTVASAVVSGMSYRYFKHVLEVGTPFTLEGATEICTLGILYLTVPLGAALVSTAILSTVGTADLFSGSNTVGILPGVLMIGLSFLFRHGASLQEKCDVAEDAAAKATAEAKAAKTEAAAAKAEAAAAKAAIEKVATDADTPTYDAREDSEKI